MTHRRKAHDDGAWIREAALAHEHKRLKADRQRDERSREEPPSLGGEAAHRPQDPSERSERWRQDR
jgi:hypothetical protein